MKTPKFILILFLALAWIGIWSLPTGKQLDLSDQLAALPEHDLRSMAEEFWSQGQEETAVMVLDYIIDQEMADKASALQRRQEFVKKLEQDQTPIGRLKSAGWGLASGEVKNWESLAGSTVGDLFVYGDLRDLTRELAFENDTDEFAVALSALGLAATLFPPADAAISMVKGLKKAGVLAESVIKQLSKVAKTIDTTSDAGKKIEYLKEALLPFYDLSKHTKTWAGYATLIKHTDSLDQVKAITKIAGYRPGNSKKLSQILSVASTNVANGGKRSLDVILTNGQKGMDSLYAAIRKGPKGLKFIADHPTLATRGLKNVGKATIWGRHEWDNFARDLAVQATLIKASLMAAFTFLLCWLLTPQYIFQRILPCKTAPASLSGAPAAFSSWPSTATRIIASPVGFALGAGFLIFLIILLQSGLGGTAASISATFSEDGGYAPSGNPASSPVLSSLMVVLPLGVQLAIWISVRNKLVDIDQSGDSCRLQLKRLENLDTFLDLPLYAGLALTVCSFLIINYNPGVSRLLAYISTVVGIIAAVSLRINIVHPLKERLLKQVETGISV